MAPRVMAIRSRSASARPRTAPCASASTRTHARCVAQNIDEDNPNAALVLATAVPLLFVGAGFQFFDGIQVTGVALLRGLKDTRTPMIMAVISYWLFGLPTAYLLGFVAGWGGPGIWMGLAIGLAGAAILLNGRYYLLAKRLSFT